MKNLKNFRKGLVSLGKCISKKRQSQAVKEEAQVAREKPR
jgi:hypothetical protein